MPPTVNRRTQLYEYAKLSSAHFIFLTAIIPVTGAIAMGSKNLVSLTFLFLIGVCAHTVGFAYNHYRDIDIDRLSTDIAQRPLLQGTIPKRHAQFFITAVFLTGFLLTLIAFGWLLALIYLAGISLAALYDLYSKRLPGMDLVLAAAVATGVAFGAATVSTRLPPSVLVFCALAFLQTLNLNLIAGGLKDADHDHLIGSRHLAPLLGVRADRDAFHIPGSFKALAYLCGGLYTFIVFAAVLTGIISLPLILLPVLFAFTVAFFVITYKMLSLPRFNRQEVRKYVVIQYMVNWLNIPVLLMSVAPLAVLMILYPIAGLIVSNLILYRTIFRPQVL